MEPTDRFNIQDSFSDMAKFFHKFGFIIIEDAIDQKSLANLKVELYVEESKQKQFTKKKDLARHNMHKCFFEKSPEMVKIVTDSRIVDFVQHLISDVPNGRGNNVTAHLIHNNAFIIKPGGRGQAPSWHTDDALQNVIIPEGKILPDWIKLPVMVVTCMIWLTDCLSVENGPTHVVPGSHRFGSSVDPDYADLHKLPACDVIFI